MLKKTILCLFLAALAVPGGCKQKDATEIIDMLSALDVTLINYQSSIFTVPDNIPLNQDLGAGRTLSFTAKTETVQTSLLRRGFDFTEIKRAVFRLRMELEPQNFEGVAEIRIYVSRLVDAYADQQAVIISSRKILPTMYDFSGEDARLNTLLQQGNFYIGFEFIIEPSRVSDRHIALAGKVDQFDLTVTGTHTLSQSTTGY